MGKIPFLFKTFNNVVPLFNGVGASEAFLLKFSYDGLTHLRNGVHRAGFRGTESCHTTFIAVSSCQIAEGQIQFCLGR
jgi:hypothetical protein